AHPAQHQEYAKRTSTKRKRNRAGKRPAHEFELDEGADQGVVHTVACSSKASHMRRASNRFSAVRTFLVSPHATGSRASSSVSGKLLRTKSMSCSAVRTDRC